MVNVGVIGLGYWGPNLLRNFYQLSEVKVGECCDLRKEKLEYVKNSYPTVRVSEDYLYMLNNPEVDAVVVATPPLTHYKIAKQALLHNKHVLVEKPLALDSRSAQELIDIAKEKGKVLMVGHTFEYNAAVRKIKEYLKSGEIGDIYYIYAQRLNLGRVRQDVNVMWNLAPHDISIVLYWLEEEPLQVSARGITRLQKGLEDVVFMNLDFSDDKSVHIHLSWLDPNKVRRITIVGSKKMIIYDDTSPDAKVQIFDKGITRQTLNNNLGKYDDFGKFQLIKRAGDILIPQINFVEPLSMECSHFIECIQDGKRPLSDGEDGLKVIKVLEAAQKSLKANGIPVEVKF